MKRFLSILFIASLFTPLSSGIVRAAEQASSTESAPSDFKIRQDVLAAILKLTASQTADLQARLKATTPPTDEELSLVYETLVADLKDHLQFIDNRTKELNSSYTTLDGVRVIADNFKKWRETIYDPATQEIFDFLVLRQGDTLFSIVEARYQKILSDVEKLKLTLDEASVVSLQALLADATKHLTDARLLRDKSKSLFLSEFRTGHPQLTYKFEKIITKRAEASAFTASVVEGVLPSPSSSAPVIKIKTILDTLDLSKETVQTLMKRAVDEITSTYKIFLQMRDLVRQK